MAKRTERIEMRVTSYEKALLQRRTSETNLGTLADYIRSMTFGLARKHGLTRAKEIMQHREENSREIREHLKKDINRALDMSTCWEDFKAWASK